MSKFVTFIKISKSSSIVLPLLLIYLVAQTLSLFIPELLSFPLISYLFMPEILNLEEAKNLLIKLSPIIITYYTFYLGLKFPWRKANLYKKKLYRTSLISYITIIAIALGILYGLQYFDNPINKIVTDNLNIILFIIIAALPASKIEIGKIINKNKANGPLTSISKGTATIYNIISFILITVIFRNIFVVNTTTVITSLLFAIIAFITLTTYRKITKQKSTSIIFKTIVILVLYTITQFNNVSFVFFPLFCGILFSLQTRGSIEEIFPFEFIKLVRNILLLLITPFIIFNNTILYATLIYLISKNIIFSGIFFTLGKTLNLNESVYKNIAKALLTTSIFALPFAFILTNANILEINHLHIIISTILLATIIETIIHNKTFAQKLHLAGETSSK